MPLHQSARFFQLFSYRRTICSNNSRKSGRCPSDSVLSSRWWHFAVGATVSHRHRRHYRKMGRHNTTRSSEWASQSGWIGQRLSSRCQNLQWNHDYSRDCLLRRSDESFDRRQMPIAATARKIVMSVICASSWLPACLQLIRRRQQLCRAFRFFGRTYMYLELRPHRIDQRLQEHADALQVRITDGQTDYPVKQQSAGSFLPRYHIYGCDRGWTRRRTTVASDTIAFGSDLIRSDGTSPTVRNRPQSDTAVT